MAPRDLSISRRLGNTDQRVGTVKIRPAARTGGVARQWRWDHTLSVSLIHFVVGGRGAREKMAPKDDDDEPVQRLASWWLRNRWTDKLYLVLGIEADEGIACTQSAFI